MRFRIGFVFVSAVALAAACSAVKPSAIPSPRPAPMSAARCAPWVEPRLDAGDAADEPPRRHAKATTYATCEVADDNIAAAEKAVLGSTGGAVLAAREPWDRIQAPKYFDAVAHRLLPTKEERALLQRNGFAVRPYDTRTTYAWAFHDIYRSELPLYVSADAILHAVYVSHDQLVDDIERQRLAPALAKALSAIHCALGDAAAGYPVDVAHDADLYLTVARSLLEDRAVPSVLGADAVAATLVASARAATGLAEVHLFGRTRLVDWSQYRPRGHYIDERAAFFRAATWLGRLEFNLVSRSSRSSIMGRPDPSETPREAIDALALADLAARAGVQGELAKLDRTWTLLAGRREDVSLADLATLARQNQIAVNDPAAFEKLKAAIGPRFARTTRFHPMPEGAGELPAIATFLGPRITPETAALQMLVHGAIPERHTLGAGDVAYVLGVDRARQWIPDRARFPALDAQLDRARDAFAHSLDTDAGDLYGAWLGALRGGARRPEGQLPTFMQTEAYDDLRVDSIVAGYGQLRHDYVLVAAQGYDEGGCEIPDAYVEPRVGVYDGIVAYAQRGAAMMGEVDPADRARTQDYFARLEKVARVLGTIARHELEGRAMTEDEKSFLGMIVEMLPGSTAQEPTYTGWYFDLFRNRWHEALTDASFVADYFTSGADEEVAYVGATGPQLGIFVIDTGGGPRMAVGPVARGFGARGPLAKRYASVGEVTRLEEPWAASYASTPPKGVPFGLRAERDDGIIDVYMTAPKALPSFEVEVLDHHGAIINSVSQSIPGKKTTGFRIFQPRNTYPEGLRIHIGEYAIEGFVTEAERAVTIESVGIAPPTDAPRF